MNLTNSSPALFFFEKKKVIPFRDNLGYRNKIFIGTSRKNHCNHKDNAVKSSDKNISVQENWMGGKISDLEKVPIKIGTIIIVRYAIGSRDIPDYYMRRTTYCDNKRKSTS